jgi:excisionase family DNA binding protein
MSQDLFSVEQVANRLGLHARTVRNYVRDGRLRGTRIGKQYRISREALEAFSGHPITDPSPPRRDRHVEVSSVVQIDAISAEAAGRVTNTIMAAARSGSGTDQPLRIDSIHDQERGRMKVIVSGGLAASVALLRVIGALAEAE